MDIKSESSESSSVLSDAQCELLEQAGCDVRLALDALTTLVRDNLSLELTSETRTRRMLPATPTGKGLSRCNSARSPDRRKLTRQLSLRDFDRSNEL